MTGASTPAILSAGTTATGSAPSLRSCAGGACCRPCRESPSGDRARSRRAPRGAGRSGRRCPYASIERSAPGSISTSMPPPEVESEPPDELPRVKLASIPPPEVSALTWPPASTIRIPPPDVSASMSPVTRSSSIEPPELSARIGPSISIASTPPPEVSAVTRPLMFRREIPPPEVSAVTSPTTSVMPMPPPDVSARTGPSMRGDRDSAARGVDRDTGLGGNTDLVLDLVARAPENVELALLGGRDRDEARALVPAERQELIEVLAA